VARRRGRGLREVSENQRFSLAWGIEWRDAACIASGMIVAAEIPCD